MWPVKRKYRLRFITTKNDFFGIESNHQFFVGRNNHNFYLRLGFTDQTFAPETFIFFNIKRNSQEFQIAAHAFAGGVRIFANSAGQNQNVQASHGRDVRTNVFFNPVIINIKSKGCPFVSVGFGHFNFAHVRRNA